MYKRICTLGFLALSLVCGTAAATTAPSQPASTASIEELLRVTQAHKLLDSTMARMDGMMRQSAAQAAAGQPVDAGEQKIIDAQIDKMNVVMKRALAWDSMKPMYLDLYSKNFSQQDVDGMLAFYRTPAGQSMIAKMPALMAQIMQTMQVKMAALMPQIQQIAQDTANQLKAYRASKQNAAAPAAGKAG